jgi:hypothetical protein
MNDVKKWPLPITVLKNEQSGLPMVCAGALIEKEFRLWPKPSRNKPKYKLYADVMHSCLDGNRYDSNMTIKERMKWYSDNIGTGFFKAWNGAMWKTWVGGDYPLIGKLCNARFGKINPGLIKLFRTNEAKIRTAIADGIWHVVPLIHVTGMDPHDLKDWLGKGLWKQITRNSFTRNRAIAYRLFCWSNHYGTTHWPVRDKSIHSAIRALASYPSTVIPKLWQLSFSAVESIEPFVEHIKKTRSLGKTRPDDFLRSLTTIADTRRMAAQVGAEFNPNWPYATVVKKHEEWTKAIMERKFSPKPWDTFGWPEKIEQGDYTLTLLNNALGLKEEGSAMHHCVGSYVDHARRGDVIVYSVRYKGERLSTLQFGVSLVQNPYGVTQSPVRLGQHYGPCNRDIPTHHKPTLNLVIGQLMHDMNRLLAPKVKSLPPIKGVSINRVEPVEFVADEVAW